MTASIPAKSRLPGFPWPRTLRQKVILAFVLVVLLAVGNILIVRTLLKESDGLAVAVNVAGKMRMLSQRIALETLAGAAAPQRHVSRLKDYQDTFDQAYHALMSGGAVYGLTVPRVGLQQGKQLAAVGRDWQIYQELIASITQMEATMAPAAQAARLAVVSDPAPLLAAGDQLLGSAEALLDSLVGHARDVQLQALYSSYVLFLLDLCLLLLAYAVVSRQVLRPIRSLVRQCHELASGNFAARSSLRRRDELGRLGRALDESAAQIEQLLAEIARERASLRQAALVYEHTSEAMVVTDADGHVRDINPAFTIITGYQAADIVGKRLNVLSSGRHGEDFYRDMWRSLEETGHWSGDIWNRRKSGDEFAERLTINTSYNPDGSVNCRIGLFSDVTEKRRREASIWRQAHYDHLTQLPNRQMFHASLQQCIEDSRVTGLPFALVFLDLDLFKEVNDTFGHDEGDELLRLVSRRLTGCIRGSDLVARLGGDEFTLIIQGLKHLDDVRPICQKVLDAIAQPYNLGSNAVHISASVGVTFYPRDGRDAVTLLKHADLAMYAAKEKGRNQYCLFSPDMQETAQMRRDLLRDLQHALEVGEFVLTYQPIVDMRSERTVKAEALIRWQHPARGQISPAQFIPLAEDTGLIVPIGDWAFHEVTRQVQAWRRELAADFEVSINVSPVQFQYEGLDPQAWIQTLQTLGLPGNAISVEITERLLMDAEEESSTRLLAFRDAGIQVALDDFGTGYSSLSYLKRFDVDFIKIDQSFVRNLAEDSEDLVLCQAIILMAHQLGMQVIAEGIETREQHDLLLQAGCDFGQGFLYARPLPPDDLVARLRHEHQAG